MPKLSSEARKLPAFDLKSEREKRALTQADTAAMLFTTQSSVARWEADGDMPQIHRAYWALYWKHNKPPKKVKNESE
jgi:transcriptional regulator with XRE-family HTH domain